jgi:hypothetical protein
MSTLDWRLTGAIRRFQIPRRERIIGANDLCPPQDGECQRPSVRPDAPKSRTTGVSDATQSRLVRGRGQALQQLYWWEVRRRAKNKK